MENCASISTYWGWQRHRNAPPREIAAEGKGEWLAPGVILAVVVLASGSLHWRINDLDDQLARLDTRLSARLDRVEARLKERMAVTEGRVESIENALAKTPVFLLRPQLTTSGGCVPTRGVGALAAVGSCG